MMGRIINRRSLPYSICLVCEGSKTEPYFFVKLVDDLGTVPYKLYTDPQINPGTSVGVKGREIHKRTLVVDGGAVDVFHFPYPLNYVEKGKQYLEERRYDEVWVIYDKDNHPQHADAWQAVLDYRKNKNNRLNLIFSSRCFEYYLLEHFEYINKSFDRCECKGKDHRNKLVYQNCCRKDKNHLPKENACDGVNNPCINGYARNKQYWEKGAGKSSDVYELISNLWVGICNSHRLKWWSLTNISPQTQIYERNPYLNAYRLTLRLNEMASLEQGESIVEKSKDGAFVVVRNGDILTFSNDRDVDVLLNNNQIRKYNVHKGIIGKWNIGKECHLQFKVFIQPHMSFVMNLKDYLSLDDFLLIRLAGHEYFCALEGDPVDIKIDEVELTTSLFTPLS